MSPFLWTVPVKRCPALPSLPYLRWSTNETLYNTTVRPECEGLHRLSDPDYNLRCTTDEKWNNTIAIEDEIRCESQYLLIVLRYNPQRSEQYLSLFRYKLLSWICLYVCICLFTYSDSLSRFTKSKQW